MVSLAAGVVLLAGCAAHQKAPTATFDRIGEELQTAVSGKAKTLDEAINQAMLPPLQLDLPASAQSVEPRFDLAVSNAPAAQVFMALVSGTRYSMLLAPDVSGSVTLNLKNVTVREALETLRDLYGYEFRVQGTRIYIQSNTMQTRIFQINYLAGKRHGQSDVRVTSGSITTSNTTGSTTPGTNLPTSTSGTTTMSGPPSSQISTSTNSDFWHELTQALNAIVGKEDGRSVIINAASGVVLVKALPAEIRSVENYLRLTQAIAERQVMLEAKIIEVALSEEFQSGVNWASFNRFSVGMVNPGTRLASSTNSNPALVSNTAPRLTSTTGLMTLTPGSAATAGSVVASAASSGLFGMAFQSASFAALLNFLETQGNTQVLSSPRIATVNNQKAVLKVGTDEFFVTNVSSAVTSSGTSNVTTPTITLQPFFSGIALDVTPQIDAENNIVLHVHPSISVVTEKQKTIDLGTTLGTFTLPLANSTVNETDSIVRVQDGNIVAIGGLMKQSQLADASGLPGSTGSSGIGLLFGARESYRRKSELVVLIKPTIIRNESSWKDDLVETQTRIQQLDPRTAAPQGQP
jgi:MSHA biogenesis protein MshL